MGSSTGEFETWLKEAVEVECLSLCRSSGKGTWREGSLAGDPEGYLEKTLETGRYSVWGNLEESSSTGNFESWMKGL